MNDGRLLLHKGTILTSLQLSIVTDTVRLEDVGNVTYIYAAGNKLGQFDKYAGMLSVDSTWQYYSVDCGHEVMVDRPDKLVEILSEVAGL